MDINYLKGNFTRDELKHIWEFYSECQKVRAYKDVDHSNVAYIIRAAMLYKLLDYIPCGIHQVCCQILENEGM